eukprot:241002-Prymnesium_polylepis.1
MPAERRGSHANHALLVRCAWAFVPLVLRKIVPVPNLNAVTMPYAALPCAPGAAEEYRGCAIYALDLL